jgi:hypothetical protein
MDLDAKACYDRIMATFGMLCSRYFGMPTTACMLHGTTIAEMKHHVKMALGISSAFFNQPPNVYYMDWAKDQAVRPHYILRSASSYFGLWKDRWALEQRIHALEDT